MNNACPTCGAIYNVAAKDVGRRIKCKKCGASLEVSESGLEIEDAVAPHPTPTIEEDEAETPRRKKERRLAAQGFNPMDLIAKIGGIPTLLFGLGVFLVIFTGFQVTIGRAKLDKRQAAIDEGQAEMDGAQRRYNENKEKTGKDDENIKQLKENWEKKKKVLEEERLNSDLANKRSAYFDRYVLMFGFLFIAFGCLGYLQADYGMVLRIVAAVILVSMVLALFKDVVGHDSGGPGINAGVKLG